MLWFLIAAFVLVIAGLVVPMTDPYCEGHGPLSQLICFIAAVACVGIVVGGKIFS